MQVYRLIDELVASGESMKRPAVSPAVAGKWRLRWSEQVCTPPPPPPPLDSVHGHDLVACHSFSLRAAHHASLFLSHGMPCWHRMPMRC